MIWKKGFKEDFPIDHVEEILNTFNFDYMVKLQEVIFEEDKTVQEAYDEVKRHGNSDIKLMMIRQSKESDKARGN